MRLDNMKKLVALLVVAGVSFSCSDRKLMTEAPNANLDPLPKEVKVSRLTVRSDALESQQWAMEKIGLKDMWSAATPDESFGSNATRVVIVSTGIDYNHPDLAQNIAKNKKEMTKPAAGTHSPVDKLDNDKNGYVDDFVGYDVVDGDGLPFDKVGMGTAAAGIIGAVHKNGMGIRGIASDVSMVPVRYIGNNGLATMPHLISAMKYAKAADASIVYLHLANLAFAEEAMVAKSEKAGLKEVFAHFQTKDIPVVVNAGNLRLNLSQKGSLVEFIGQFPNVFVVTSTDSKDARPFIANFGLNSVDTSAPGEAVVTTLPGNRYGLMSGTYVAAAHVAGALVLAMNGKKVPTEKMFQALRSEHGGDVLESEAAQNESLGGNRLNVAKFLKVMEKVN